MGKIAVAWMLQAQLLISDAAIPQTSTKLTIEIITNFSNKVAHYQSTTLSRLWRSPVHGLWQDRYAKSHNYRPKSVSARADHATSKRSCDTYRDVVH